MNVPLGKAFDTFVFVSQNPTQRSHRCSADLPLRMAKRRKQWFCCLAFGARADFTQTTGCTFDDLPSGVFEGLKQGVEMRIARFWRTDEQFERHEGQEIGSRNDERVHQ